MKLRRQGVKTVISMKMKETAYNPGYYIVLSITLVFTHILVREFTASVGSGGFNYHLTPLYDFLGNSIEGVMGQSFVDALFSSGPFLFSFSISFLLCFIYLSVNSIYRFCVEENTGALKLVCYGPVNAADYALAVFLRDCLFAGISAGVIIIYSLLSAGVMNLVFGPLIWFFCILLFITAAVFSLYSILLVVIAKNTAAALFGYLGVSAFFLLLFSAEYTVPSGFIGGLSKTVSFIFQWISPLYYFQTVLRGFYTVDILPVFLGFAAMVVLSFGIYAAVKLIVRKKGGKPA